MTRNFVAVAASVSIAASLAQAGPGCSTLAQLKMAQARWEDLRLDTYSYDIGKGIGSPFGYGKFHVLVKHGKCIARHFGGVGFGRPKFFERFTFRACDHLLPGELMAQVVEELGHGRTITQCILDTQYGFAASIDTDHAQLEDAGWGYEITKFRAKTKNHGT
jgi:hypothetical protein